MEPLGGREGKVNREKVLKLIRKYNTKLGRQEEEKRKEGSEVWVSGR